ncbi:MAG: PH domain-containing protein [Wenzhouxiangella sp.]
MPAEYNADLPEPLQWSQPAVAEHPTASPAPQRAAFSNEVIDASSLPDFQRAPLQRVSARFAPYAVLTSAIFWLVLVLAVVLVPRLPMVEFALPEWAALGPGLALLWFCSVAALDARRRRWALREHDLIYHSGLIWQRTAILPFARIQHVETASGPIERMFGLMRVKCFTAGGMSADLTVEGLERDAARRVRQYLLDQISEEVPAADEAPEAESQ